MTLKKGSIFVVDGKRIKLMQDVRVVVAKEHDGGDTVIWGT